MADPVAHKDVVLAVLGASSALAGLVLVFLGLIVGAYGGLAGDVPKAVKKRLRATGIVVLVPFALGLICVAACLWWLLAGGLAWLYVAVVVLFAAQLVGLAVGTAWTLRRLLWA